MKGGDVCFSVGLSPRRAYRIHPETEAPPPTAMVPEEGRAVQRTYRNPVPDLRMRPCQGGGLPFGTKKTAPQCFRTAGTVECQASGGSLR
jgi:hypothetical protein